jgi:hypothetical protein
MPFSMLAGTVTPPPVGVFGFHGCDGPPADVPPFSAVQAVSAMIGRTAISVFMRVDLPLFSNQLQTRLSLTYAHPGCTAFVALFPRQP